MLEMEGVIWYKLLEFTMPPLKQENVGQERPDGDRRPIAGGNGSNRGNLYTHEGFSQRSKDLHTLKT